jgi:hypothetical protein
MDSRTAGVCDAKYAALMTPVFVGIDARRLGR